MNTLNEKQLAHTSFTMRASVARLQLYQVFEDIALVNSDVENI